VTSSARLTGIITPICTPLDATGAVDKRSLERLVSRQLDAGSDAIFALGSSGEAIYLDDAARVTTLEVVVSTVSGAAPVLAGALAGSTMRVIQQAAWIERWPVAAIVVTAPFYANVSAVETVRHFEAIAASTSLPVVAYDIPGNVGRKIPVDVVIDLFGRDVIAGLKDTSGEMADFRHIVRKVGGSADRSVMIGSDRLASEALAAGADGIVPGIGNVCPDLFVELYAACRADDGERMRQLQAQVDVMAGILDVGVRYGLGRHASELGALKHLLHRDGLIETPRISAPLEPLPSAAAMEVEAIAASVGR
jgi:4-hydroxy-tetrahydrodipicolinate synthase